MIELEGGSSIRNTNQRHKENDALEHPKHLNIKDILQLF